ncbi:hypothetical protein [uncultured Lamprocystis sp.]|jgi:hypothetical protein|uniref:hypothetical protein n=1 Tax=uncultured Lamprocystis sp. TaxID=543132 RepID=UPI0025E675B9|nr:hypothetical protein [uncultured Lamprocystis sp.]
MSLTKSVGKTDRTIRLARMVRGASLDRVGEDQCRCRGLDEYDDPALVILTDAGEWFLYSSCALAD